MEHDYAASCSIHILEMAQTVRHHCLQCGRPGFDPWVRKILWRRKWQPTAVFLPGESLWTEEPGRLQSMGSKESDMTEQLTLSLSCLSLLEVSKLFFSEWLTILHSIQQGMRSPICMLNSICYCHYFFLNSGHTLRHMGS